MALQCVFDTLDDAVGRAKLIQWAPDGALFAVAHDKYIRVVDAESLDITGVAQAPEKVKSIEWANDSRRFLVTVPDEHMVQLVDIDDLSWRCRLSEGAAGLHAASWSPDGTHVFTFADFALHTTAWHLESEAPTFIEGAKNGMQGLAVSSDGHIVAVLYRHDTKDNLAVYTLSPSDDGPCEWDRSLSLRLPTHDAQEIVFAPDDATILIRDDPFTYRFLAVRVDGTIECQLEPYRDALGLRVMAVATPYICLGSFDRSCRFLDRLTWDVVATIRIPLSFASSDGDESGAAGVQVFAEQPTAASSVRGPPLRMTQSTMSQSGSAKGTISRRPRPAATVEATTVRSLPCDGWSVRPQGSDSPHGAVRFAAWDSEGRFCAVRCDDVPHVVWILDVSRRTVAAIVVLRHKVHSWGWQPGVARLLLASGSGALVVWEPEGVHRLQVDEEFPVRLVKWNATGRFALVVGPTGWHLGCFSPGQEEEMEGSAAATQQDA